MPRLPLPRCAARGLTLVELVVALLILSIVALGLAQTLITAQGTRRTSANWMRATQLAEEQIERLRAGQRSVDAEVVDRFTRSWRAAPVTGYSDLQRVDVTVSWEDGAPRSYTLTALVPDRR